MIEKETLASKIFALLKGNGLKIKIFDNEGAEITDPKLGRRFFVTSPNIMITIDEDENNIEFSKGSSIKEKDISALQKNVRRLADEFLMNSSIKVFGKDIQPRDYSYEAKNKKAGAMMENSNQFNVGDRVVVTHDRFGAAAGNVVEIADRDVIVKTDNGKNLKCDRSQCRKVPPKKSASVTEGFGTNSLMLSKVYHELDYSNGMTAADLADNIPGADLNDVQRALNALVNDSKVEIIQYVGKYPVYGKTMEEAITEAGKKGTSAHAKEVAAAHKRYWEQLDKEALERERKHGETFHYGAAKVVKHPIDDKLSEGLSRMFGSRKTSHQTLENVRILVKHKTPVDENIRGARSRHISSVFLECNGERFRFPHNYLPGARAMAQHLAHGGEMGDKVGNHIIESTNNLLKLQSFNRYVTTNKLINEDSSGIIETIKENILTLRTELKKLAGTRTYESVKARVETFEKDALEEDDVSQLKDLFTIRRFDEKFEEVLPIVKQLVQEKNTYHKRIEEAAAQAVLLRHEAIDTTPMFEFSSENARLGFKLNELALRIVENDELSGFINSIGTKLCREGAVNDFECAILKQVLENAEIETQVTCSTELKESAELTTFFEKYIKTFY